jgi:cytoskeletal protein RodZ
VSVGETLSRARRKRGLSVDDVSADTRIRATLVAAIEADEFGPCGGAVYARGHIRSIARVVGIDPEPLVAEFDDAHESERPPVAAAVAPQPTDPELVARSERHKPNWTIAIGLALVAICVLAAVGLVTGHNGTTHHHTTGTAATGTTKHHPQVQPPASPPPSTVAQLPVQRASMLIRVLSSQTWLSIHTKSGGLLFEGLLPAGQHKLFTNKHGLSFIIGNAPVVDVVVNGHDIGSPPSSGSVSKGNVTPGADTVQLA